MGDWIPVDTDGRPDVVRYTRIYLPSEVVLGAGALNLLRPELYCREVSRALLLYGEGLNSLAEDVKEALGGIQVRCMEVEDLHIPTRAGDVEDLAKLLHGLDFVVAVGGSEVMDLAKAVASRAAPSRGAGYPAALIPIPPGIDRAVSGRIFMRGDLHGALIRELTPLYPSLVILDPELVEGSGPCMLLAEALLNSLETVVSYAADKFSLLLAEEALRAISRASVVGVADAYWAALCAAIASERCGGCACSTVARSLSVLYGISYYAASTVLLAPWLRRALEAAGGKLRAVLARSGLGGGEEVVKRVEEVVMHAGLPSSLSDLGIRGGDVDLIVEHAWTYGRSSIEADPCFPDKYSLREFLAKAIGGRGG